MMDPYWIIVNNDIAFSPGLLKELVEKSKKENVGMVKGKEFQWDLFLIKDFYAKNLRVFWGERRIGVDMSQPTNGFTLPSYSAPPGHD